ncbi:MAG: hypothetical protein ACJASV_000306 [Pseudorhodobacter sp.]|jgi:hypothetical protein
MFWGAYLTRVFDDVIWQLPELPQHKRQACRRIFCRSKRCFEADGSLTDTPASWV